MRELLLRTGTIAVILRICRHGSPRPAFDLPVHRDAPAYLDPKAAVVVGSGVLPDRARVVTLELRPVELADRCASDIQPELLSGWYVGVLVDAEAEEDSRGTPAVSRKRRKNRIIAGSLLMKSTRSVRR
ncbi:MAG: hypothetical protein ACYCVZ_07905 [Streptosporangiaceae bacterium]